jgi:hypothetical protein
MSHHYIPAGAIPLHATLNCTLTETRLQLHG